MQILLTSGKPRVLSDEVLFHSAPSMTPRSRAGRISPPGRMTTEAPRPLKRSADMPTVRYLIPLRSSGFLISPFLNQPRGWVGMGPKK